jgi:hypothetical protein
MTVIPLVLGMLVMACDEPEVVDASTDKVKKKTATSGDADVMFVFAREEALENWTFHVKVQHKDINWYDYTDGWDVVLPDGTTLLPDPFHKFTKHIPNPHVAEQPFTRTQKKIKIPKDVTLVRVRAHDKKHGWGGAEIEVNLTVRFGENYSVKRAL